jgi:hypothetical protein
MSTHLLHFALADDRVPIDFTWEKGIKAPERPRDWNFEGSQAGLLRELTLDAQENPEIKRFIVQDDDDGLYSIWRES